MKRVYIEITNQCNLRCSFCLAHERQFQRMSVEQVEHILKQVKPLTDYIYLHVQGEPFLHPQFNEILSCCDRYEMKVQLVTNGSLFQENLLKNHPCLRKVSFSLQSLDFQSSEVEPYLNRLLNYAKWASTQELPYVEFRFWNRDQLQEKSKACLELLRNQFKFELSKKKESYRILHHVYVHFDDLFKWPELSDQQSEQGFCYGGKEMLAILSDGRVVPCCLDAKGVIAFGNIFSQSLEDILSGERYVTFIEALKRHRFSEPLCRSCTYRCRFD